MARAGRDVQRLASRIRKRLRDILARRFPGTGEFLRGLRVAYHMARAADEALSRTARADQELRRLHRLMPAAARELGKARLVGSYSLEAFEVDLGRCLAAGEREVMGERLELIQAKYRTEGVRAVHPGVQTVVFGKARFEKRG